jgi:serine/threonine protein kinase
LPYWNPSKIDIWSVGTIFAELVLNRPLLPGRSELDQIEKTISLLGSPHDSWPDFEKLPLASTIKLPKLPATSQLHSIFNRHLSPVGLDFLNKMMSYDPNKRLSAEEALAHPFWEEKPRAVAPSTLLRGINAKLRKGITLEQIRDDPR